MFIHSGDGRFWYPELKAIVGANVPNYQGMFLRGHGSQNHTKNNGSLIGNTTTNHASGNLGAIQGDAIREVSGTFVGEVRYRFAPVYSGAFYETDIYGENNIGIGCNDSDNLRSVFSIARVTPTANEIRPSNVAVKWLILAKD